MYYSTRKFGSIKCLPPIFNLYWKIPSLFWMLTSACSLNGENLCLPVYKKKVMDPCKRVIVKVVNCKYSSCKNYSFLLHIFCLHFSAIYHLQCESLEYPIILTDENSQNTISNNFNPYFLDTKHQRYEKNWHFKG